MLAVWIGILMGIYCHYVEVQLLSYIVKIQQQTPLSWIA